MLYELIAVAKAGKGTSEVKELALAAGRLVISQRGVVRSLANWGTYLLTKPVRKHQEKHTYGHHFVMRFDCSPTTQEAVNKMLTVDPRVVKYGIVKLGDGTLKGTADYGPIQWTKKSETQQKSLGRMT